jgi:hypothetical protein
MNTKSLNILLRQIWVLFFGAILVSACGAQPATSKIEGYPNIQMPAANSATPTQIQTLQASSPTPPCNPEGVPLTPEEMVNCGKNSYTQVLDSLTTGRRGICGLFLGWQDREDSILPPTGNWKFVFHKNNVSIEGDDWDYSNCPSQFSERESNKYECEITPSPDSGRSVSTITFGMSGFTIRKYVYGNPSGILNGLCGSMTMSLRSIQLISN